MGETEIDCRRIYGFTESIDGSVARFTRVHWAGGGKAFDVSSTAPCESGNISIKSTPNEKFHFVFPAIFPFLIGNQWLLITFANIQTRYFYWIFRYAVVCGYMKSGLVCRPGKFKANLNAITPWLTELRATYAFNVIRHRITGGYMLPPFLFHTLIWYANVQWTQQAMNL